MGSRTVFIDTSGFFAWANLKDPFHQRMSELPGVPGIRLVTTDYILDETSTLFVARGISRQRDRLRKLVGHSNILSLHWVDRGTFWDAWDLMEQYAEHPFSFTDCVSFVCMRELRIEDAATTDHHFAIAGFQPLLRDE